MRASTSLGSSLARMTVDLHRSVHAKRMESEFYKLTERMQQFQYGVTGKIGFLPTEDTIHILFDIMFLYEYGNRRDSQLLEPQVHFGFSQVVAPPGTIPYAHVVAWKQDADLNYVGATVVVGAHNPSISLAGAAAHQNLTFKATLHATFQGYGVPLDPSTPDDDGSNTSASSGVTPSPADPSSSSPVTSASAPDKVQVVLPTVFENFASGPLGGTSGWDEVASWNSGGSLGDWEVPDEEGSLQVESTTGLLTATGLAGPPGGGEAAGGVQRLVSPPSTAGGDKFAAMWTNPGKVGNGHKVRLHFKLNAVPQNGVPLAAVVVNIRDRQRGLAFWFGGGAGWVTDLRLLGTNQDPVEIVKEKVGGGATAVLTQVPVAVPFGQSGANLGKTNEGSIYEAGSQGLPQAQINSAWSLGYNSVSQRINDAYVEIWRDGNTIRAALWLSYAGSNGVLGPVPAADPDAARPVYASSYDASRLPAYDQNSSGYFGWTLSWILPWKQAEAAANGFLESGLVSAVLYKRA